MKYDYSINEILHRNIVSKNSVQIYKNNISIIAHKYYYRNLSAKCIMHLLGDHIIYSNDVH